MNPLLPLPVRCGTYSTRDSFSIHSLIKKKLTCIEQLARFKAVVSSSHMENRVGILVLTKDVLGSHLGLDTVL